MNVYDFDDTIYNGESCLHLFRFYIKRYPYLLKKAPRVLFAFAKYKMGKITAEQALNLYGAELAEMFKKIPDMRADAVEFWDIYFKNIKPFYKELQKPDDLIITASPEIIVEEACKRLDIHNLIGSVIDPKTGEITRLCMRSNKIKAFFEAYPDGQIEDFYTDSPKNDKPLIDIAKRAFIVKGNKITQVK